MTNLVILGQHTVNADHIVGVTPCPGGHLVLLVTGDALLIPTIGIGPLGDDRGEQLAILNHLDVRSNAVIANADVTWIPGTSGTLHRAEVFGLRVGPAEFKVLPRVSLSIPETIAEAPDAPEVKAVLLEHRGTLGPTCLDQPSDYVLSDIRDVHGGDASKILVSLCAKPKYHSGLTHELFVRRAGALYRWAYPV